MRSAIGFILAMLFVVAWSPALFAQQFGEGPGPDIGNDQGNTQSTATFSERKAHVLKLLDMRKTRLEEETTCVKAAQNDDDLVKCRPRRQMRQGGMQGGRMGGPGQRPPMGGGMGQMP